VRQSANAKVQAKLQKILRDLFGYRRPAASVAFRAGLGKLWAAGDILRPFRFWRAATRRKCDEIALILIGEKSAEPFSEAAVLRVLEFT
jgi:hypothetical protein